MMIDIKKFLLDILKDKIDSEIIMSTGRINDDTQKSIFLKNSENESKSIYKQHNHEQKMKLIITWSDNYTDTREKSLEIYNSIKNIKNELYDENTLITCCDMVDDFPRDYETENILYSQVIDFTVNYCTRGD